MCEFFIAVLNYNAGKLKFHRSVCTSTLQEAYDIVMMHKYKSIVDVHFNVQTMMVYKYRNGNMIEEFDFKSKIMGVQSKKSGDFIPISTVKWIMNKDNLEHFENILRKDTEIIYADPLMLPNNNPPNENEIYTINVPIYDKNISFKVHHGYMDERFQNLVVF